MRYRLLDGRVVVGRSYDDIVQQMADYKLESPRSMDRYMRATARRAQDMYGVEIDATTARTFIRSLHASGLLTDADREVIPPL